MVAYREFKMKIDKDLIDGDVIHRDYTVQLVRYGYSRWIKTSKDSGDGKRVSRNGVERDDINLFTYLGANGLGIYE
jgi:hypothetical protein